MVCNKCGKQLNEGAKFCDGCGNQVVVEENVAPVENAVPAAPVAPAVDAATSAQPVPAAPAVEQAQVVNQANTNNQKNNSNFFKKNWIFFVVGLVVVIVLIIILVSCSKSTSSGELPSSSSSYYKVCKSTSEYENLYNLTMTFGLYEKNGKIMQDNVVEWAAKSGKIKIKNGASEEEVVSAMAQLTGMSLGFENSTSSNQKNYMKNGKVYITNTLTYDDGVYKNIDELVTDFETNGGAKCN